MLYTKDKEIIEKLKLNSKGKYQRFSQGDIDYIISTIHQCARLENEQKGE